MVINLFGVGAWYSTRNLETKWRYLWMLLGILNLAIFILVFILPRLMLLAFSVYWGYWWYGDLWAIFF